MRVSGGPFVSNRHLVASFDPASGELVGLGRPNEDRNFIEKVYCSYGKDDVVTSAREADAGEADAASRLVVERVRVGRHCVESVIANCDVKITRRYALGRHSPLLEVRYQVEGVRRGIVELPRPGLPCIDFADSFNDAFEDEKDLYFDGAELGRNRELPCWRVFLEKGHQRGLILATRSKAMMGHVQILARGIECHPNVLTNYDTGQHLRPAALKLPRTGGYVMQFELGPWAADRHAAIVRAAKLNQPVRVPHPRAQGKPAARQLKGEVVAAASVAGRAASTQYHPRKWMLVRVPWGRQKTVLFANAGTKPPAIRFKPGLTGVCRIFAGVGNGAGLILRVPGCEEPVYCLNGRLDPDTEKTPFHLWIAGRHRGHELECGTFELDGRPLSIEALPNPHQAYMLDYLRFEPLSAGQQAAWRRRMATPPRVMLTGFADTPDIAHISDAHEPTAEPYRANIWAHKRCGYQRVYWRIDGQCSDFPCTTNTMRYVSAKVHGVFSPQSKAYGRALRQFDLLQVAVEAAKAYDIELYGWMRFNNYTGNVASDFFKHNPQFHEEWERGNEAGKLCLALPEVRKHKIDILVEAASYGLDGLNLGFLRHPPVLLYHPVLVEGYRRKFGVLPPRNLTGHDLEHRHSLPETGEEYVRWFQYRADFMTRFGHELKAALKARGLEHVKIAIWIRANHALFDGIDVDAWVSQGLCDEIIPDGIIHVDAKKEWNQPTTRWLERLRSRVPVQRGISAFDFAWSKKITPTFLEQGCDGICTYESNMAVLDPDFIRFYESLRTPVRAGAAAV